MKGFNAFSHHLQISASLLLIILMKVQGCAATLYIVALSSKVSTTLNWTDAVSILIL